MSEPNPNLITTRYGNSYLMTELKNFKIKPEDIETIYFDEETPPVNYAEIIAKALKKLAENKEN